MKNISINIIGASTGSYPAGITPLEISESVKEIPKNVVICKVDDVLTDLNEPLDKDATIQFLDAKSKDGHSVLLHSTAHLMAQAVKRLFPKTKVTIGPYLDLSLIHISEPTRPY